MTYRNPASLAAVALLTAVLAGCGGGDSAAAPASPPTSAAASVRPAAVEIECVSIERAYKVWQEDLFRPTTAADFASMDDVQAERAVEYGKSFYEQVRGYDSQASKALTLAVAEYNAELTLIRLQGRLSGIKSDDAETTSAAAGKIEAAYAAWKSTVCA